MMIQHDSDSVVAAGPSRSVSGASRSESSSGSRVARSLGYIACRVGARPTPRPFQTCYQQATEAGMLEVMSNPLKLRERRARGTA